MRVLVIGGGGKMGRGFARYFKEKGSTVAILDRDQARAEAAASELGVSTVSLERATVEASDLLFVSVPIPETPSLLRRVGLIARPGLMVAEIASLKRRIIPTLRRLAKAGVRPLSLHPLFGPGADLSLPQRAALIPVMNGAEELEDVRRIFPNFSFVVVDEREHDRAMAVILWATYALNVAFASLLSSFSLNSLRKLATPRFTIQHLLAEGAVEEEPQLYAAFARYGLHTRWVVRELARTFIKLENTCLTEQSLERYIARLRFRLSSDIEEDRPYEKLYRIFEALSNTKPT